VKVTTTTIGTTPASTTTPSVTTAITSGTTVAPTSVQTTTICQKSMAQIGGVFVASDTYSVEPVSGTNKPDLTNPTSNGITFPAVPGTNGIFDQNNNPVYNITLIFNPSGANSISSIVVNPDSNVNEFGVEFFVSSIPNQSSTTTPQSTNVPTFFTSTMVNSQPSLVNFPSDLLSPLSGIRITILSTTNNQ
jgi:hypothetical protein